MKREQSDGELILISELVHFPIVSESHVKRPQSDGESKLKNLLVSIINGSQVRQAQWCIQVEKGTVAFSRNK